MKWTRELFHSSLNYEWLVLALNIFLFKIKNRRRFIAQNSQNFFVLSLIMSGVYKTDLKPIQRLTYNKHTQRCTLLGSIQTGRANVKSTASLLYKILMRRGRCECSD